MYRCIIRGPCRSNFQCSLQQITRNYNAKFKPKIRKDALVKVIAILSPIVIAGGTVTYAKYDQRFRHMLEKNIPGAESFIKVVLKEDKFPFGISKSFGGLSKSIDNFTSAVNGFFSVDKSKTLPAKEDFTGAIAHSQLNLAKNLTLAKTTNNNTNIKPDLEIKTPVQLASSILELEHAVEVAGSLAIKEYKKAIDALKSFNAEVFKVVDQAVEHVHPSYWDALKNKTIKRDFTVEIAEDLAKEALSKITQCEKALTEATTINNHEQAIITRKKIKKLVDQINKVKLELDMNKDLASVSENYWRSVKKARNYFIEEIESIFPGLNLAAKQLNMSKEDLDLFITYAYSHVLAYQKELLHLQTVGEQRLQQAIKAIREGGESEAVKSQVEFLIEAEKRKIAIENEKKIVMVRVESERILREKLRKQSDAHIAYINGAIALKESELKCAFKRELEEKLAKEEANFQLELAGLVGKMRGIQRALETRSVSECAAHKSRALWTACQALWTNVKTRELGVLNWKYKLRPLKREIEAIAKISAGDEFVAAIIRNLPREAEERGVFPVGALRERFLNVERVARKVALVPEDGGTLPTHFFSYLQSIFISKPNQIISKDELNDHKFDYGKLDTYDILYRARYFVERDDLLNALRYMNLLQGAPRIVARDWLKEARVLLETQQAAKTLMAHAAVNGIMFL